MRQTYLFIAFITIILTSCASTTPEAPKGKYFYFPPGLVHQETALTDCKIIEASTPHFNDRVRVEKKFGIINKSGLQSTSLKQIIFK